MANISALQPYILPSVSGCPDVMVDQATVEAAMEFCARSKYWKYEHDPITTISGVGIYELTLPDGSQLETILSPSRHDTHEVFQRSKEWLDDNVSRWETLSGEYANYLTVVTPGEIRLVPEPNTTKPISLALTLALKPLPTATTIPDHIFNEFYNVIANGAKAILLEIPGREWTNSGLAQYCRTKFDEGIDQAASKARSGFASEQKRGRVRAHFM